MSIKNYDILGVNISPLKITQINSQILDWAKKPYSKPMVIFKPYVEFLAAAEKDKNIRNLLNQADINVADATSIQWAGSYLYAKPDIHTGLVSTFYSLAVRLQSKKWRTEIYPEKMGGVDMTLPLLKQLAKTELKVGILGGPKDTISTQHNLKRLFPKLNVARVWSGYYVEHDSSKVAREISTEKLDILFVAMGFPKQEKFIISFRDSLHAKVLIGEGGSFDYDQLGGSVKRAPSWIRKIGLEWFWRLARQPWRLKRQLAIPRFIFAIRIQKKHAK